MLRLNSLNGSARKAVSPLLTMSRLMGTSHRKINLPKLRASRQGDIAKLEEVIQRTKFIADMRGEGSLSSSIVNLEDVQRRFAASGMSESVLRKSLTASLATFLLHVEARIASSLGVAFYTIGPCGEELLSAVGSSMRQTDASALHYRHVATAISRQLDSPDRTLESILLDRARSYVCSTLDPVTGGKHCAIGGLSTDFLVTSTLSSQASPAVGRALGVSLSHHLKSQTLPESLYACEPAFPTDAISYASLGDGSVNNGHFLSALNLAEYAQHRGFKCPIVFGISNNNICISLKNYGWLPQFLSKYEHGPRSIRVFKCDGNDIFDVYRASQEAFKYSRSRAKPSILVFDGLVRRFGHAGTDRQLAYYSAAEVAERAEFSALSTACKEAVALGVVTAEELAAETERLVAMIEHSFDVSVNEPKIAESEAGNAAMVLTNSQPLASAPGSSSGSSSGLGSATGSSPTYRALSPAPVTIEDNKNHAKGGHGKGHKSKERLENMRKQMTRVFDEILGTQSDTVYIGEDVQHGGYYLVTDGLAAKYPYRVMDFPPDETSLMGVAVGYSQAGMTPIIEMPYAKYLDCGADMFFEAVIMNWLSNGKQPNGLMLRLQGFDKGVFGGNYHTHNTLHIPAGLDVVCYSNGYDYVRGMRYCMRQARAGRVVMSVDSTDLLNRRHVDIADKDDGCLSHYPFNEEDSRETTEEVHQQPEMSFDDIVVYSSSSSSSGDEEKVHNSAIDVLAEIKSGARKVKCVVVTYGNGVPTTLLAVKHLLRQQQEQKQEFAGSQLTADNILVVDCPYLSALPGQLEDLCAALKEQKAGRDSYALVLADVCKESGNMPLHQYVLTLQHKRLLPNRWNIIGAANTYNPLSRTGTFLNESAIQSAMTELMVVE